MSQLQQCERIGTTHVRYRGCILTYFGGCDYFGLASHTKIKKALIEGLHRYGLNVAASRRTSGNHPLYARAEKELARFFRAEAAVLFSSGYVTNLAVAQTLAGRFSHVLLDDRAHVSLIDAAQWLNCPVLKFKSRNVDDFASTLRRCGAGARPVVMTDGMFGHDGSVAPLRTYSNLLPREGLLLVDDAHGAGTLGPNGRGAIELEKPSGSQVAQCVTLSKAFGAYGGALIGSKKLRDEIVERSSLFIGGTPLPLPLVHSARAALRIVRSNPRLRSQLNQNLEYVRGNLRQAGFRLPITPGPILQIHFTSARVNKKLERALFRDGILPPFVHYPGGPGGGYFRFAISSKHTREQLAALISVLSPFANASGD